MTVGSSGGAQGVSKSQGVYESPLRSSHGRRRLGKENEPGTVDIESTRGRPGFSSEVQDDERNGEVSRWKKSRRTGPGSSRIKGSFLRRRLQSRDTGVDGKGTVSDRRVTDRGVVPRLRDVFHYIQTKQKHSNNRKDQLDPFSQHDGG